MRILVLQHIACEPPGAFEDVMVAQGADLHRVELDEGEPLPGLDGFDAIVAMGGPMSVNDEAEHPWLVEEKALIRTAVERGVPLGLVPGRAAAGGLPRRPRLRRQVPEVGVLPVELTPEAADDPVFAGLPQTLATLQWHGDTFDLPDGAVLLATSPAYRHQAFRVGPSAYGVQFHIEVTPSMGEEWATIPEYAAYADRVLGPGGSDAVLADFRAATGEMQGHARGMFERWLALVPARAGHSSAST